MDEYKDISGYDGLYGISRSGQIVSFRGNEPKILSHHIIRKKYGNFHYVILRQDGKDKHCNVAKLVAETYVSNPNHWTSVRYKNGDTDDLRAENLEWCKDNRRKICAIDDSGSCVATFKSIKDAQNIIGRKNIGQALRVGCRCGGYYWKYVE